MADAATTGGNDSPAMFCELRQLHGQHRLEANRLRNHAFRKLREEILNCHTQTVTHDYPDVGAPKARALLVDLQDITLVELRAARRDGLILPGPAEQIPVRNEILQRVDDEVIDIRLVSTFESPDARISVDLLVRYSKKEPFDATQEVLTAFVHRVGLLAGYPYLREAVSSMSAKLGVDRMNLGLLTLSDVVEVLQRPVTEADVGGGASKSINKDTGTSGSTRNDSSNDGT